MAKTAVFLYTKSPSLGSAKTRIAGVLGNEKALLIHQAFLKDILSTIDQLKNVDLYIACTPLGSEFFDQFKDFRKFHLADGRYYLNNIDSYVGNLTLSFKYLFSKQYEKVLGIHADCPDLPKKFLEEALEKLDSKDFILGPTMDGGFYLLGFKQFYPRLFYEARHGTNYALEDIRQICKETAIKMDETPPWWDIDTIEDLKALIKRGTTAKFSKKVIQGLR